MPEASTYLWFGSTIAAVGIGLVLVHIRTHRLHQGDGEMPDIDRKFYDQQYSRRMQTSALLVTLGALIGLCGYLKVFEESPVFATCYVIGLLLLAMWLILLAVSDAVATRIYSSRLDRRSRDMQKSLQEALSEVRQAHGLDTNP